MEAASCEVLWSPAQDDKFVLHGSNIHLYRVEPVKPGQTQQTSKEQILKLSEETQANLLSSNTELTGIRCVSWYPSNETLLAVGLNTGKVVLTNFSKGSDANSLNNKELIPRKLRPCTHLAWNPRDKNLIAETLEKVRQENSILIYDVSQKGENLSAPLSKATYELGMSESISSFAWFHHNPKSFVTGANNKSLRIHDLRDTSRPRCLAYTKAVHGIAVDKNNEHRLASFQENHISLWDTRNFEKSVLTIEENKPIVKISWCPTRHNVLACLTKDSAIVKLYDIINRGQGPDENDSAWVERYVQPYASGTVSWFDWHHTHHNRMLTVNHTRTPKDIKIFEKIAVSWSANVHVSWACGRHVQQVNTAEWCLEACEDISLKMKRRAKRGYGIQADLGANVSLTDDDHLKNLWRWLNYAKLLPQEYPEISKVPLLLYGIKSILKGDVPSAKSGQTNVAGVQPASGSPPSSDLDLLPWQLRDGHKLKTQKRIFRSQHRTQALILCCWGFDKDSASTPYIDNLEREADYERAATVAVFTLRMGRAIQVLNNGASKRKTHGDGVNLHMVAMALSGYYDNQNTLWREMCASLYEKLENPYLRAMFAFLTCEDDRYENVLSEDLLAVVDKVAFVCVYLPDVRLQEYISGLSKNLIEQGNLDGICLTGLSAEGVNLLQRYVDITGDIQTVCVTSLQGLANQSLACDERVQTWITEYRSLLDVWKMWTERAEFDVYRQMIDSSIKSQQQVYACCNFCGKTIGYTSMAEHARSYPFGSAAQKTKVTSCPGCRKPLPRCSLCLVHMGTPAGTQRNPNKRAIADKAAPKLLTPFSDWFTWCQTCRHGGHANHMTDWFSSGPETECPVTGCSCKCTCLDPVSRQSCSIVDTLSNLDIT